VALASRNPGVAERLRAMPAGRPARSGGRRIAIPEFRCLRWPQSLFATAGTVSEPTGTRPRRKLYRNANGRVGDSRRRPV